MTPWNAGKFMQVFLFLYFPIMEVSSPNVCTYDISAFMNVKKTKRGKNEMVGQLERQKVFQI